MTRGGPVVIYVRVQTTSGARVGETGARPPAGEQDNMLASEHFSDRFALKLSLTAAALQGLGVRIAIDDVGTGHSGLSYMLKLGVDIIKIDKMFIDSVGIDHHSNTIIGTLVDLAQNMRMDVVAEGVETFEQVEPPAQPRHSRGARLRVRAAAARLRLPTTDRGDRSA
jgi:hypothetical protein